MLDGYHNIFAMHAGQEAIRPVDVPRSNLGVEPFEVLRSIPILTQYDRVNRGHVDAPAITDIDKAAVDGIGDTVNPSAFPKLGWLGDYGGYE